MENSEEGQSTKIVWICGSVWKYV